MPLKFMRRQRVMRVDMTDTGTVTGTTERLPDQGYNTYDVVWDSDPDWVEENIPELHLEHGDKGAPRDAGWRDVRSRDLKDLYEMRSQRKYFSWKVDDDPDPSRRVGSDRKYRVT